MPILYMIRDRFMDKNVDYMSKMIDVIWNSPAYRKFNVGCTSRSSEMIKNEFEIIQRSSNKYIRVKIHCFEIVFENDKDLSEVENFVSKVCLYLGSQWQVIASLYIEPDGRKRAAFAMNSISYRDFSRFNDNNTNCRNLVKQLGSIASEWSWSIRAGDNIMFDNSDLKKSYEMQKYHR